MNYEQKILIVDDKQENLLALEKVLSGLNVKIIKALSGNEALKTTLNHEFALAILDVQMPEMDGYELAAILRSEEKTKPLPMIFLSAVYSDEYHVFKGYEAGAVDFVSKPYEPFYLVSKVKIFLQLYAAKKELEAFSYSVSHDLRAPIRAIDGFSKILLEDHADKLDDEGERLMNIILKNARKMGNLIDDILEFSRLGRKNIRKSRINVEQLAEEIFDELKTSVTGRDLRLSINTLPNAYGDTAMIRQVMENLISNAVKYTGFKDNAVIEIGGKEDNNEIVYYVKDNGAGFDMKYADKLFGVFQRLHSAGEYEGTGIGLSLVKRIIEKHDGKVWAEGKVDEGATFYFTLPNNNTE